MALQLPANTFLNERPPLKAECSNRATDSVIVRHFLMAWIVRGHGSTAGGKVAFLEDMSSPASEVISYSWMTAL